jgi:hypothetical protein
LITAAALLALVAAAAGAVQITARETCALCLPPAVVQAWS